MNTNTNTNNRLLSAEKLIPDELLKYEIAKELGLYDKVLNNGWKSLSAKETGRIGGLITKKKREYSKQPNNREVE